jgi:hypothetical protein
MGNMDFLVAWDYTMISRDKFIGEIEGAAKYGDIQIVYREGEDEDDLSSDVERVVERHVKQKEIEKAKEAIEHRQEQGFYQGGLPYGLKLDENKEYLIPSEEFGKQHWRFLELYDQGSTYAEIADETPVSSSTAYRIVNCREFYEEKAIEVKHE